MEAFSTRYEAALVLTARTHRAQVRKGSDIPYVTHPVHVSVILLRHGFPEDVVVAGLLHDVVEDQGLPLADVEAGFGPAVAGVVSALTERKQEAGVERPWEVRKQEMLEQLQRASAEAIAVKAADTLHNARTLAADLERQGPAFWRHFTRGPAQSLWYYRCVAAIARERLGAHPLLEELDRAVGDLEQTVAGTHAA